MYFIEAPHNPAHKSDSYPAAWAEFSRVKSHARVMNRSVAICRTAERFFLAGIRTAKR
jgi:hypothetical protein